MSTYNQFKDIDPALIRGILLGEGTTETTTDSQNEDGIMSRTTPSATPSTEQTEQEDLLVTTAQTMANASTDREALANAIVPPTPELRPQDFDIGEWETLRPIEDVLSSDPMYDMAKEDAQVQAAITSAKGITRSRTASTGSGEVLTDVDPIKALDTPEVEETELPSDSAGIMSRPSDTAALEGPEATGSSIIQSLNRQEETLERGAKGNAVLNAQLRLSELGYDIGRGGKSGLKLNSLGNWTSLDNSELRGVDASFGPSTEDAIKAFQKDAGLEVTGALDPDTAKAMANKEPIQFIIPDSLTEDFSETQKTNINAAKKAAEDAGLQGAELAAFMAQVAHESDKFRTTEEYASGAAYEGREDLGNTQAGDGERYKGRGYIQLTGRANYKSAGKALGLDLINNPELVETPENAAAVSLWFWENRVRPKVPDFLDTERVTKLVNGGFMGLEDRKNYLETFTKKWNE